MMVAAKPKDEAQGSGALRSEVILAGILALLAADRDDKLREVTSSDARRRTEVVLADAGLSPSEIGKVLNKKPNTVAKIIQRARAKDVSPSNEEPA